MKCCLFLCNYKRLFSHLSSGVDQKTQYFSPQKTLANIAKDYSSKEIHIETIRYLNGTSFVKHCDLAL